MALVRSQSAVCIPADQFQTRTYSRPTFATRLCSGAHWPSSTPCFPYSFSYYYPLSSSYYYYYKPWRLGHAAYRYYRTLADTAWEDRFTYYSPSQRVDPNREWSGTYLYPEYRHRPLFHSFC